MPRTVGSTFTAPPNHPRYLSLSAPGCQWTLHRESTCGPCRRWGKQVVRIFCMQSWKHSKDPQKVRVRVAIVQKHGRVDGCEGPYIVAHCVSGLFRGFVGYENCWRNGECCRMGFHRLSLLLYHACDWRSEECSGSRRCTSYPEKQRSQSCVKIYSLPCKSLCNIVYGSTVNFHSGNHIVLWAYLFMGWPLCNTTDAHLMVSTGQQKLPACVCLVSQDAAVQHLGGSDSDVRAQELT